MELTSHNFQSVLNTKATTKTFLKSLQGSFLTEGIDIETIEKVDIFFTDSIVRSVVKNIKCHNGYHGSKCFFMKVVSKFFCIKIFDPAYDSYQYNNINIVEHFQRF